LIEPAPEHRRRNILVVGVDPQTYGKIAPVLERVEFEVDRFPSAASALELIERIPFMVLVVGFPLADIPVQELLDAVRRPGSPCRRSPLLLLTTPAEAGHATTYVGRGANRVVSLAEPDERLQAEVTELLRVAPRSAVRTMLRIEVRVGDDRTLLLCQTENISATGLLIRTERRFPLGTRVTFELALGDERHPIRGRAQVVRHTLLGRDPASGMGLRLMGFEDDAETRFLDHLRRFGGL
jgi:DNA-binding response OmpR family regulator